MAFCRRQTAHWCLEPVVNSSLGYGPAEACNLSIYHFVLTVPADALVYFEFISLSGIVLRGIYLLSVGDILPATVSAEDLLFVS
jgi:hypothetical protein